MDDNTREPLAADLFDQLAARLELVEERGFAIDANGWLKDHEPGLRRNIRWHDKVLQIKVWMETYDQDDAMRLCRYLLNFLHYSSGVLYEMHQNDEACTRCEILTWIDSHHGCRAQIEVRPEQPT